MNNDVTRLVERLELFEERLAVRLEALFASIAETGWLTVNGELHPRAAANIDQDVTLHVDAYDQSGRLVAKATEYICAESFFGFQSFEILLQLPVWDLSKIRIYPKPSS